MSDRRRMRRAGLVAVAAAIAVLLSACVGIPTSGSVIAGREVSELEEGEFEIFPEGPVSGADQESILRGFTTAFSGSGNYEVARQFLTRELAESWDPRANVLVRNAAPRFVEIDGDSMEYSVITSASVDASGSYGSFTPATQSLPYQFVQEDGEWRISSAPDGIVLSSGTFTNLFAEHTLYFLDPTRQSLVPDLRWFPAGTAATRVVSALLDGPPPWLQGAVGTAFPDGTQLTSPQLVAVESNIAIVDLTAEALAADEGQRQLMRVQLEASLGNLASVSSVEISVAGTPLTVLEAGQNAPQPHPQIDNRALVMKDGEFGYYANDRVAPIDGLSNKIVETNPRDATVSAGGDRAVALGEGGVYLVSAQAESPLLVDSRPGLTAPSLDNYGFVWSAQAADPTSIRVFDSDGNASEVAATLPAGATIVSLTVSRDGARVAIFLDTNAGPRLIVAAIGRDANRNQLPVILGEPKVDVISNAGTAIDATWLDELSVATLSRGETETAVEVYTIGGQRTSLGSPGDAIAIVGGNSANGLRVLGSDGEISARRGSGWQGGLVGTFIATQR